MKRKRGGKAGHKKGNKNPPATVIVDPEDNNCSDQNDDCQVILENHAEAPSVASNKPSIPDDKLMVKTGPSRVKVKLRPVRALEPGKSCSDTQTLSETAMSSPKIALEVNDKVVEEDSTYSDSQTSELKNTVSDQIQRKAGSIKIKPSRSLGLLSDSIKDKNINKQSSQQLSSEKNLVPSDSGKPVDISVPRNLHQKETKSPRGDLIFDKKELSAALAVIRKVMKMDAAGPFNAPVDPVALGLPDYFDIIDNPMDFGTICHDLETGSKYVNSGDVYKDVQFVWENCYKYNNKGDYVIDLMKRVKKNFMKYWTAAGLYSETPSTGAAESTIIGGHDKLQSKSKAKHKRRRYGIDLHKSDCMCAVCVVRRRRKERNESQIAARDVNHSQELKLEAIKAMKNKYCGKDEVTKVEAKVIEEFISDVANTLQRCYTSSGLHKSVVKGSEINDLLIEKYTYDSVIEAYFDELNAYHKRRRRGLKCYFAKVVGQTLIKGSHKKCKENSMKHCMNLFFLKEKDLIHVEKLYFACHSSESSEHWQMIECNFLEKKFIVYDSLSGSKKHQRDAKRMGSSPAGNHLSEDATSSLDHSPETDANAEDEIEERTETPEEIDTAQLEKRNFVENGMEIQHNPVSKNERSLQSPRESGSEEDSKESRENDMDLDFGAQGSNYRDDAAAQEEAALAHCHKDEEKKNKKDSAVRKQSKLQDNPLLQENHSVLKLCSSLFPTSNRSVWNGPHSLICSHVSVGDSPIQRAVAALMKQ